MVVLRRSIAAILFTLVAPFEMSAFGFARVLGEPVVTIKPCQPAFFMLEIGRDDLRSNVAFLDLMRPLLERVTVNDRVYGLAFGGGFNKAAALFADPDRLRELETTADSFQAALMLFFDTEDKRFLFQDPGRYHVALGDEVHVTVVVEEPNPKEAIVAQELSDMGVEFIGWVLEGGHRPELARKVEQLLEAHPNTVYSEMLSVSLGPSKLLEARDYSKGVEEADRRWSDVVAKYFSPYAKSPINSPFQATAVFQVARHASELDARRNTASENERQAARQRAKVLFEEAAKSPYSARFRKEAQSRAQDLQD